MESRAYNGSSMELPPIPEEDPLPTSTEVSDTELVVDVEAFVADGVVPHVAFEQSARGTKTELDNERRVEVRDEPGPTPIGTVLRDKNIPQPAVQLDDTDTQAINPLYVPPPMPQLAVSSDSQAQIAPEPYQPTGMYRRAMRAGFLLALVLSAVVGFAAVVF